MEGRTYRFFTGQPLYAFGHGLSYTTFDYSNLHIPKKISASENLEISVDVTNSGTLAGDEVIQVYVKDLESSVRVPLLSLQGFERIHLKAGETKTVNFTLEPEQLALLNNNMQWEVEEGEFQISVGGHQPELNERSGKEIQVAIIKVENP